MQHISAMRAKIECLIIKNYDPNILKENEALDIKILSREFSDYGKKVFDLLLSLIETQNLDKEYLYLKTVEVASRDFFKLLMDTEEIINIYPYVAEYEKYIQLTNQHNLATYLMKNAVAANVILLTQDLIQGYKYNPIAKDYKTFRDNELVVTNKEYEKFSTGVEFLDSAFNDGLQVGQLVLVSGEYETGKTTLCTQIIENISEFNKVCFFCFEFTISSYIQRRNNQPNPRMNKDNIIIITDGYDIQDIKNNIEILYQTQGIKVFLIDSQMRIENNSFKNANGEEKESEKFEILGKLSHRLGIIIMLIIQTSKQDPDTPFKSKKGAHEASIIIHLLHKDTKNKPINSYLHKRLLKVKKNKQTGKHFKEEVIFNEKTGFFEKDRGQEITDDTPLSEVSINEIAQF